MEYGAICTLEQLSLIWPALTGSRPVLRTCGVSFPPLIVCRNASILGFTYRLLAGEGQGNLLTFYPKFKSSSSRTSIHLHSYDPASHLRFQNPCNFHTLDRFRRSWQATIVILWDSIPAHLLLLGHSKGRRLVLKDLQRFISSDCT